MAADPAPPAAPAGSSPQARRDARTRPRAAAWAALSATGTSGRPEPVPLGIAREIAVDPTALRKKRALDLALALPALLIAGPVIGLCAAWVRAVSAGPAFFRQERVGQNGRPFVILKLRTMHVRPPEDAGSATTLEHDPRLIKGARTLRRLKLDELPQLWHVVEGRMSLVGPRPTVLADVSRMTPVQRQRLLVPPGLTGLAQVQGNTSLSWPKRIELDLAYVRNLSVGLDLRILGRTLGQIASGRADTHPPGDDEWGDDGHGP